MAKPHRHTCSTDWDHEKIVWQAAIRSNLSIRLVQERRAFYPPGDKPACCVRRRKRIVVLGEVLSARDASQLAKLLKVYVEHGAFNAK